MWRSLLKDFPNRLRLTSLKSDLQKPLITQTRNREPIAVKTYTRMPKTLMPEPTLSHKPYMLNPKLVLESFALLCCRLAPLGSWLGGRGFLVSWLASIRV